MIKPTSVVQQRANLKRLVNTLEKKPFVYLPERSVECLHQFFVGYSFFGPPIWRDFAGFECWLSKRLFYPKDSGAHWSRFIQLNARDRYDSFEWFWKLYRKYCKVRISDIEADVPESKPRSRDVDFFLLLYAIGKRPGMYMGAAPYDVRLLAAHLAGYFTGKRLARVGLTKDEKAFHCFEEWLCRHHKLKKRYPWYRLIEMWPSGNMNSFDCFFAEFDAYLTNFGKTPRGLDDLFEILHSRAGTTIRRRKKRPLRVLQIPESKRHWRGYYFGWKPQS